MADDKKEIQAEAVAEVVEVNSGAPAASDEKQGSKCCGCCCDFRRAVIVMGLIGLIISVIYLILAVTGAAFLGSARNSLSSGTTTINGVTYQTSIDDGFGNSLNDSVDASLTSLTVVIIIQVLQALFYVFQIVAAVKFNVPMLAIVIVVNLVWFVLGMITIFDTGGTTGVVIGNVVFYVLFIALEIYPTGGLIKEIKGGTMSKETYPREAYSCCCQPNPV